MNAILKGIIILILTLTSPIYADESGSITESYSSTEDVDKLNSDLKEMGAGVAEINSELLDIKAAISEITNELSNLDTRAPAKATEEPQKLLLPYRVFDEEPFIPKAYTGTGPQKLYFNSKTKVEAPPAIPVPPTYIIEPPDTVSIYVQGESGILMGGDRDHPIRVRPDGRVSVSILGEIYIEGMTPKQASEKIEEALKKYIRKPSVNVEVMSFNSKKVYITGAVGSQTTIPYTGNQTVLDIIIKAGYQRYGARNYKVRLIRPDVYHPKVYVLNINKLLQEGYSKENMYVFPNDIIYVEPTILRWFGEQVNVLLSPIYPVINVGSAVNTMWDLSDRMKEIGTGT